LGRKGFVSARQTFLLPITHDANGNCGLKCGIDGAKMKNSISGSNIAWGGPKNSPPGRSRGRVFLDYAPKGEEFK